MCGTVLYCTVLCGTTVLYFYGTSILGSCCDGRDALVSFVSSVLIVSHGTPTTNTNQVARKREK